MKFVLSLFVVLISAFATADIPRPQVEPGPLQNVEADSLNVLVYGAPASKLADLKSGSNVMLVQVQHLSPESSRYTFTSRNCLSVDRCVESKQMSVTKTVKVTQGRAVVAFQASEVRKLR